jgi:hypothetical protein
MWEAPSPLRFWHLASLDAPTVAVVWCLGFAWMAHVRLPAWSPLLLALVAWTVYIGDRLLDARAGLQTPPLHQLQERHHFHWRHRRIFVPLAAASAVIAAWMVLALLPPRALKPDSVVAVATLAYFSGVHSRWRLPSRLTALLSREFLVGTLFTAGCILPVWCRLPVSQSPPSAPHMLMIPMAFFAALAWLNCRAIGHWESESHGPTADRFASLKGTGFSPTTGQTKSAGALAPEGFLPCVDRENPTFAGVSFVSAGIVPSPSRVFQIACLLALTGSLACVALAAGQPRSAAMLAAGALSALLLAGLDRLRPRLTPLLLRTAADLVLLTPIVLLPFALRLG